MDFDFETILFFSNVMEPLSPFAKEKILRSKIIRIDIQKNTTETIQKIYY